MFTNLMASIGNASVWLMGLGSGPQPAPPLLINFVNTLRNIVTPVMVVVGIIALGLAIWIGFRLAMADEEGKRKEAKKQLMWAIIALGAVIILAFVFGFLPVIVTAFMPPAA